MAKQAGQAWTSAVDLFSAPQARSILRRQQHRLTKPEYRQVDSPKRSRAGFLRTPGVMATTSNMFLYSLTIQPPTTITQALLGQFSGTKEQQIITASGSRLTLLQPDPRQGKVNTVLSHDIFGIIRAIASFRLAGSHKGK